MINTRAAVSILGLFLSELSFTMQAQATPNYHLVGWFNTFIPGGGQFLLGNPLLGSIQAVTEVGTFGWGYSLSARSPLTLDGVPDQIPNPQLLGQKIQTRGQYCAIHPTSSICSQGNPSDPLVVSTFNTTPQDIQRALGADILQEIGIKYHMVNVYNSYREAVQGDPNIDPTPTGELFLSPFRWSLLSDPVVYIPLGVSFLGIAASYYFTVNGGISPSARLTAGSNRLYAFTYGVVYPFGSAVPEEMFYRGFLQNEFRNWVDSPFFSIPLSTAAYAFSHSIDGMPTAAITGAWLGTVTHISHGRLGRGIAYHFWADFLAGLLEIELMQRAQFYPYSTDLFNFTWYF